MQEQQQNTLTQLKYQIDEARSEILNLQEKNSGIESKLSKELQHAKTHQLEMSQQKEEISNLNLQLKNFERNSAALNKELAETKQQLDKKHKEMTEN